MSDPVTHSDIEDVLSSIRRLVSEDTRPKPKKVAHPEKLLLTPALRIEPTEETAAETEAEPETDETQGGDSETSMLFVASTHELVDSFDFSVNRNAPIIETAMDIRPARTPAGEPAEQDDTPEPHDAPAEDALPESADRDETPEEDEDTTLDVADVAETEILIGDAPDTDAETDTAADDAPVSTEDLVDAFVSEVVEAEVEATLAEVEDEERPLAPADDALERKIAALERLVSDGGPQDWDEQETASVGLFQHNPPRALSWQPSEQPTAEASEPEPEQQPEPEAQPEPAPEVSEETLRQAFVGTRHEPHPEPQTERRSTAEITPLRPSTPPATSDDEDDMLDLLADEGTLAIDEEMLRDLVGEMVRQELQGALGERITRNVRKLVRREIHRMMTSKEFD